MTGQWDRRPPDGTPETGRGDTRISRDGQSRVAQRPGPGPEQGAGPGPGGGAGARQAEDTRPWQRRWRLWSGRETVPTP